MPGKDYNLRKFTVSQTAAMRTCFTVSLHELTKCKVELYVALNDTVINVKAEI